MATWKDVAKTLAKEALGEDSVESLSKLGKAAIDTGKTAANQVNKSIQQSDNAKIVKARNIVNSIKNAAATDVDTNKVSIHTASASKEKTQFLSATCPNCGAALQNHNGIDTMFCQYCGTKVVLKNQSDATVKAKETVKKLEHKEVMADKVLDHLNSRSEKKAAEREKQQKQSGKTLIGLCIVIVICMGFLFIKSHNNKVSEQEQDVRFQEIVQEIEEDIKNENYDAALIKANQLYLVTNTPYGNELKKKWDNTRKALVKQIEELQDKKAATTVTPTPIPKTNKKTSTQTSSNIKNTQVPKNTEKPIYYSTNDAQTVKNGNSGVYAYRSTGGSYAVYYIIDFDAGYVFYFVDGNGEETCERVRIDSGDLNNVLIITYHDGGDTWQYGLHFKWKNDPEILTVQDPYGYEDMYYTTDLDSALKTRDSKSIKDY